MRRTHAKFTALAVGLAIFLTAAHGVTAHDVYQESTRTSVGEMAPEIDVTTLSGQRVSLEKLRGKVVVLNFFATWCGPCRSELPHLEKDIWQRFKSDDFTALAIGREHSAEELSAFQRDQEYTIPMAADPDRKNYDKYAEKYIPRTYVIDREGRIVFQMTGYDSERFAELTRTVESQLAKAPEPETPPSDVPSADGGSPSRKGIVKDVQVGGVIRIRSNSYRK